MYNNIDDYQILETSVASAYIINLIILKFNRAANNDNKEEENHK